MNFVIAGIIGLFSGVASGLFGVGGGIVMVPAMVYFLSPPIKDIKQAIGTSLVVIIPTALMGSYKHFQQGNVEWRTVAALVPLAIAGSYLGCVADYTDFRRRIKARFRRLHYRGRREAAVLQVSDGGASLPPNCHLESCLT
jgi:uncharacterized membrane protein YfcA